MQKSLFPYTNKIPSANVRGVVSFTEITSSVLFVFSLFYLYSTLILSDAGWKHRGKEGRRDGIRGMGEKTD